MERDDENLGSDESRVAQLIGTLKSVEAPRDFDIRVRSRIAQRHTQPSRTSWRPILATLSATAVIVGGGYLGYRSVNSERPAAVTAATTPQAAPAATIGIPVVAPVQSATPDALPQKGQILASEKQRSPRKNAAPPSSGGSIDQALKDTRKFESSNGSSAGETAIGSVLSSIGADTAWDGSGWRVNSVKENSVANHSALRTGDVIEAVDGKLLTADTKVVHRLNGGSLRVRRNGATLLLTVRP